VRGRITQAIAIPTFFVLFFAAGFAQERWVYTYDGPGNDSDGAFSIVEGLHGNLYAAGYTRGSVTRNDFAVVSLTSSGLERWAYQYRGPTEWDDQAFSIAVGLDGNLYVAGESPGNGTAYDFTVVSLTNSGGERWVYRYNGPGWGDDVARSIVAGPDGNLYAAGYTEGWGTGWDMTVVSLSASGEERWVYRYDSPRSGIDLAYSLAIGSDGNLYAAGRSHGGENSGDFTVISMTNSGAERWSYSYDGAGSYEDYAEAIMVGYDGNIYAAGTSYDSVTGWDFMVVSLTDLGTERWVYLYNGAANIHDHANSIVMGGDGNIYVAGWSHGSSTDYDFLVVSLSPSGAERWVYRHNGSGNNRDEAESIIVGSGDNIYAVGVSHDSMSVSDFVVVSLTLLGSERWFYRYNGSANGHDHGMSIIMGSDGNLYAAGSSREGWTGWDLTVVSLSPDVGVEEELCRPSVPDFCIMQNRPNPFHHSTVISYSLPHISEVHLSIYDITGRVVETLVDGTQQPGMHQVHWDRGDNPSGVYFYRLKAGASISARKMVVVE
jgi:uncharacterized delta-60 repeat protein